MKIVLFDWTAGGHHARYARKFAEALGRIGKVVLAIPDEMVDSVKDLPVEVFPLGKARPNLDMTRSLARQNRELAYVELDLFEKVARQIQPDHLIHLYADPVIRRLVKRSSLNVPTTLCIFFPRAHYPSVYNSPLNPKERLRAWFLEYLVTSWRRRSDAHAVFTLDEEAAHRWSSMSGVPAFWFPEPPIEKLQVLPEADDRSGCVVYGALAPRKGIDLLARAIALEPNSLRVVLAGPIESGFENMLGQHVMDMERAGAKIELRTYMHQEQEGLAVLARARCAVLPYPRHYTTSRVLVEACSVGTPVIAHDYGLLGYLVKRYHLGIAVNCNNSIELRRSLLTLCEETNGDKTYGDALALFAGKFTKTVFDGAVTSPFSNS